MSLNDNYSSSLDIFKNEWKLILFGGFLSFILASFLMSGLQHGLTPNTSYPFIKSDDGAFSSIQRVIEGWMTTNERNGYPFGSDWSDYPNADGLNLLLIKFLSFFNKNWWAVHNLYFLSGFPLIFISSYIVFRKLGFWVISSLVASLIFLLLPFHFQRIGHLFYTNYLHVPIYWYLAFMVYKKPEILIIKLPLTPKLFFYALLLCCLGSLGIYFALFGLIVITTAGLSKALIIKSWVPIKAICILSLPIMLGILINLSPTLIYRYQNGVNLEVAQRSPIESEIYGLKLTQLIMPHANHRNEKLSHYSDLYAEHSVLVNENRKSSLGIVSSIGFVLAFCVIFIACSGSQVNRDLSLASLIVLVLFLFGTIGGLGSIFALLITPSFRGWNRISVFIAYGSLIILFLSIQIISLKKLSKEIIKKYINVFLLFILIFAFYDQTSSSCSACNENIKKQFEIKKKFIREIESSLPMGAAIYQLPYMPFPEVPPLNELNAYDSFDGFLYSKKLKWSYGGIKGRQGDLFYRALSAESIQRQIEIIKKIGFGGVYLDLRGYPSSDMTVYEELKKHLGEPLLSSEDKKAFFFLIEKAASATSISPEDVFLKSGFYADEQGVRHEAKLNEPVNFASGTYPIYIETVKGLSGRESWGRWSDANLQSNVQIKFFYGLPRKFNLDLLLKSYHNDKKMMKLKIGKNTYKVNLKPGIWRYKIIVNSSDENIDFIDFFPPDPTSPKQLNESLDTRKISVGFIELKVS